MMPIDKGICCRVGGNPAIYVSMGEPRPTVGVDSGEGVIARYDEAHKEVVGITLIGLRVRLFKELKQDNRVDES